MSSKDLCLEKAMYFCNNALADVTRNRPNNRDFRDLPHTFRVSDLDRRTIPNTLLQYFDRFGTVEEATLNEDDDGRALGTATIRFK
jgi:RNA recognition motif-containing protein